MARASTPPKKRPHGNIEQLPSGALRITVYAGTDPVTGRLHRLREIIPAGPSARAEADKALRRLISQVDERRNPRTNATLDQLLDQHFAMLDLEPNTIAAYRELAAGHIRPLIGAQKVGALDGAIFDSFYTELRRCRRRCRGRPFLEHRTEEVHDCDEWCRVHVCRPLAPATVRKIHFILSGALKRAVRWRWIAMNPIDQAEPPSQPRPNPQPPTAEEAARILGAAWSDPDWGLLVWLTMITGFRRGELCGLRWRHLDLDAGVIQLERSIGQRSGRTWEKGTKTHQQRRLALDPETIALLTSHRERCTARARAVGAALGGDSFVFSGAVDGSTYLKPDSVTQRYGRLAARLGIRTSIHKLRHYSATELISAGVDVRTVAGRLGHAGGGSTTLKVYAAWVSESDQRASMSLFSRMPARPQPAATVVAPAGEARSPYEKIAVQLRETIESGALAAGDPIPTVAELAAAHGVALSTAQRAVSLLKSWGLVDAARGHRARVLSTVKPLAPVSVDVEANMGILAETGDAQAVADDGAATMAAPQMWEVILRRGHDGKRFPSRHVTEDLERPDDFRDHLLAIARLEDSRETNSGDSWIGEYELEVIDPEQPNAGPVRVLRWRP